MAEVILALGATVDGATTAHWLTDQLRPPGVAVTRVGQGVPIGGALDVLDDGTLPPRLRAAPAPALMSGVRPLLLSRRALIHRVGKAGGVAAAYRTMAAMGLLPIPDAYAGPPALPPGNGQRVVIIGAGIAGMVLAWELRKAGYAPTDSGGSPAARRPQLVAARRRRNP